MIVALAHSKSSLTNGSQLFPTCRPTTATVLCSLPSVMHLLYVIYLLPPLHSHKSKLAKFQSLGKTTRSRIKRLQHKLKI